MNRQRGRRLVEYEHSSRRLDAAHYFEGLLIGDRERPGRRVRVDLDVHCLAQLLKPLSLRGPVLEGPNRIAWPRKTFATALRSG